MQISLNKAVARSPRRGTAPEDPDNLLGLHAHKSEHSAFVTVLALGDE